MNYKFFFLALLFIAPLSAFAADPSVASFVAGSYSLNSGQSASFSWNVADSGGYSFVIPCTQGIKFKKTDGSVFPCDTPIHSVATSIDGIDLSVWNLSLGTKSFTARVIPKNASGVDFASAYKDIQVSVAPAIKIIDSVTGATTASSSVPYTLSWSSSITDGVNLSISCAPTIRTTSPSYTTGIYLPCNTYLFPNKLPASSSMTLVFDNSSKNAEDIVLTLVPLMDTGVYNGAQTQSITVSVGSNIAPDPIVTSFVASTTLGQVPDGAPVSFSWATASAAGANILLSCNDHITTTITTSSASSTPKCAALAFGTALPTSGTGTILFSNDSFTSEPITMTLVPGRIGGGFDATRGKELSFRVLPKGMPVVIPSATVIQASQVTPTTTTPTSTTPTTAPTIKKVFTKNLVKGSSGAEVRALQEFLKKDRTLYPEGIVNGTFGPATERAVKRFQSKYKLGNASTQGYGGVGPKTRELLNSLIK